jgi:hypothetical protein
MPAWDIIPGEGILELRLGYDKAAVRNRFGDPRTFRRTPDSPETDQFVDSGILATYGPGEKVTFIELTHPAEPTIGGVRLLGLALSDVMENLREHGLTVIADPDGASIQEWQVGLYAPSGTVEGVSIGE